MRGEGSSHLNCIHIADAKHDKVLFVHHVAEFMLLGHTAELSRDQCSESMLFVKINIMFHQFFLRLIAPAPQPPKSNNNNNNKKYF